MKVQLVIPAAGMGLRLGADMPKALIPLGGIPMLARTLRQFEDLGLVPNAIILIPSEHIGLFKESLFRHVSHPLQFVPGGDERQHSVENGLAALDEDTEMVVIHDAARPFVELVSIKASIDGAVQVGAATVAIPSIDTILEADTDDFLVNTPDRRTLWACQTPQTFQVSVIRDAHAAARRDGYMGTDDASLVRKYGGRVKLVHGSRLNFKITTAADLALAELILKEEAKK